MKRTIPTKKKHDYTSKKGYAQRIKIQFSEVINSKRKTYFSAHFTSHLLRLLWIISITSFRFAASSRMQLVFKY